MREIKSTASIQIAGASEEYGLVHPEEAPITEENPLRPLSPYAVSKVAQDMPAYQYFQSYGLKAVRTRAFQPHWTTAPGLYSLPATLPKQIAEIEAGLHPPVIHVGDLNPQRDFTDVRDIVRAYWLSLEHCSPGEVYNVASGKAYRYKGSPQDPSGKTVNKISKWSKIQSVCDHRMCLCSLETIRVSAKLLDGPRKSPSNKQRRTCWTTGANELLLE